MDHPQPGTSSQAAKNQISLKDSEGTKKAGSNENPLDDSTLAQVVDLEDFIENQAVGMLEYERQMFLDFIHSDGLLICAKGISYDRVVVNLLKVYCDPGNLVIVINCLDREADHYKTLLNSRYVREVPITGKEREKVYLDGGIQFISTRILVVDLLKKRIPIELITGIIIMRAHDIIESCQEAFVLRLYRQSNKTGFIKAFSSSVESFTYGYGHLEKVMRNIFVKDLFLWPRFHAILTKSLKKYEITTVEFNCPLTPKMAQIQYYIIEIMNFLVKELKRLNRFIDLQEVTVENCFTRKFQKILSNQLDCVWHQLSSQTQQLLVDLKVLRSIMNALIYHDSVTMYKFLKQYRTKEYAMNNSGWVLLDSADQMFKLSRERVFNNDNEFEPEDSPKWKPLMELIRNEIPNDVKRTMKDNPNLIQYPIKVLILCHDTFTAYQLNQCFLQGPEKYLFYTAIKNDIPVAKLSERFKGLKLDKTDVQVVTTLECRRDEKKSIVIDDKNMASTSTKKPSGFLRDRIMKRRKQSQHDDLLEDDQKQNDEDNGDQDFDISCDLLRDSYIMQANGPTTTNEVENEEDINLTCLQHGTFDNLLEVDDFDMTGILTSLQRPMVCIRTFRTGRDKGSSLNETLNEMKPQYVIMYHCNVTAVRQLEVFEARMKREPKRRTKVFFLMHCDNVEEQMYLTNLRREKQAFEMVIDLKSTMVVPEYQDGKSDDLLTMAHKALETEDPNQVTRKAGGQDAANTSITIPKVIVDIREFRSDLPCLLHRRGIEVIPLTITVGDYILSPEVCVERKSVSDLIGSLNSGRLYNQSLKMSRFYSKPLLLIEFDQNRPFHLQSQYMISSDASNKSYITKKLILLTMCFPKLKIIWSPNPYSTAQLFEELKQGKSEPDSDEAIAAGKDHDGNVDDIGETYDARVYDFMLKLPGINSKNIHNVMRHGGSLKEMIQKSEEELTELLLNSEDAQLFIQALNHKYDPNITADSNPTSSKAVNKFKKPKSRFK